MGEEHVRIRGFDRNHGFKDGAFALLNPLSHGVEVGGEVHGSGEDSLSVLSFALAVELFPPFVHEVEFGLIVGEDFDFLSSLIESKSCGCILFCRVLVERYGGSAGTFHVGGTLDQGFDVEAGAGDGEQSDRCQHAESSAHVVGNDETLVAFFVCRGACCAFFGVRDGDDDLACGFDAALFLALFAEESEGECRFGGRSALGDIDDAEFAVFQEEGEFAEIVFADVVSGEEDDGILTVVDEPLETVAERFDDGTCAEVTTADASHDNCVAVFAKHVSRFFDVGEQFGRSFRGEVHPTEEIVARAGAFFQRLLSRFHARFEGCDGVFREKGDSLAAVDLNITHDDESV